MGIIIPTDTSVEARLGMPQEYIIELVEARVIPVDRPFQEGILVEDGLTLPFLVERGWSGPSGNYLEQWSIRRSGREVLHTGALRPISVRGPQSVTRYTDRVDDPIPLETGTYLLAFVIEGRFMGSKEFQVSSEEKAEALA
jgi:hypothetical protein